MLPGKWHQRRLTRMSSLQEQHRRSIGNPDDVITSFKRSFVAHSFDSGPYGNNIKMTLFVTPLLFTVRCTLMCRTILRRPYENKQRLRWRCCQWVASGSAPVRMISHVMLSYYLLRMGIACISIEHISPCTERSVRSKMRVFICENILPLILRDTDFGNILSIFFCFFMHDA